MALSQPPNPPAPADGATLASASILGTPGLAGDGLLQGWSGTKGVMTLVVLIAAGLAGNQFKFTLFFNADFIFGSIFAMLALQLFGLGRGVAAAILINLPLFFLWGHPYGCLVMTAEVFAVGWLQARRRIGFIQADTLFWLVLGMPLVYVSYHHLMKVPQDNTLFIMAKDMVNGVANVLLARLIFILLSLRTGRSFVPYREYLYNLLAFFVLCPTLILIAVNSRTDFKDTDRQNRSNLNQESRQIKDRLEFWVVNRKSAIVNLAELAASKSPQQMQPFLEQAKKSDVNFLRIGLLDQEATATAFFPLVDELGQKNIGMTFADRPFIPVLKQTLQPMLSEVVMGRIGVPKPIVTMLAPVVSHGKYCGYVSGILSLDQIREHLDKSTDRHATRYSLLDRNGRVIMTNRPEQKVMESFAWGKGHLNQLDDQMSQWVPDLPPNTPAMQRWGKSFYLVQPSIGHLAEWKLILEEPLAPYQRALIDRYTKVLAILLILLLASLAVAEVLSRQMTRSLEDLRDLTRDLPSRLALEGPAIRWPQSGIKESRQLIVHLKLMADSLLDQFHQVQKANASLERRVEERTTQLAETTRELRFILDNAPIGISKVVDRRPVWANRKTIDMFHYSKEELESQTARQLYPSDEAFEKLGGEALAGLAQGHIFETVQEMVRKDGQQISVRLIGKALEPGDPSKGTLWMLEDITARKQAEASLRESEARFRGLMQNIDSIAVQGYSTDGTTHYWNQASEKFYGYSEAEAVGRNLLDLIIPADMREGVSQAMRTMWETGQPIPSSELTLIRKDGSKIAVYSSHAIVKVQGRPPELFCMDIDLTDRKQLETQLHQSQKMESLGILAGGVAHDMNNVLGAILGLASVHLELLPPESSLHPALTTITKACTRGGNLIQSLLGFARQGLAEEKELDMNALVRDEVRLLERTTLARVRLEMDLAEGLRPILGDASALTHLLMNLCVNAVDAMPENGTLTLRTRNLDEAWIEILVEDTGIGMPSHILEKALDPFFTTKAHGKGTGLGLSIAYSTVLAHRGQMVLESEPGHGTRVKLRFPASEPQVRIPEASPDSQQGSATTPLKVLLVDDDELIQSSMHAILEVLGHTVTSTRNGEEALSALEAGFCPDVVILDLNMPGLGGAGTLPRLRALHPTLPVLLATGRADQSALDLAQTHPFVTLLSKPFSMKDLQQHLGSLLQ